MLNWVGLLEIVAVWLVVVLVATKVLDWLFPRLQRRDEAESGPPDPLPWYPPAIKRVIPRPQPGATPTLAPSNPAYWRANVRTIVVLLAIWLGTAVLPVIFAPALNQIEVLTGFPLGYYMGGQGSLIIFIGIVSAYALRMARLDAAHGSTTLSTPEGRARFWRIARNTLLFTGGFLVLIVIISAVDVKLPGSAGVGWLLLVVSLGIYAVIGLAVRSRSLDDYFVAGRRIPAFFNGMAVAGDWLSAASFISMAGTLWLLGYEGLAYILGWTGGYVLLAMLLAPYLRKFGQFTVPDFIAARYGSTVARVVAAVFGIIIAFTYVTAQVSGIGIIMSRFLGVNYILGVAIGVGSVLFCSFLGGMRAITWTQVTQAIVLLIAYLAPVTILSLKFTGVPLPQLMYGEAIQHIVRLEAAEGIARSYVTPFNDWSVWNFLALMLCLMLGTTGMPHILVRFYPVANAGAARRSVGWALAFILLLYLTAPAYAAFSRWEVLQNVVGKPVSGVPEWATNWAQAGLLTLTDANGDGVLQFDELRIDPDLVVLATPEIAGLPRAVAALVAAGGLAAALSTADGLLLVIAAALSHDIYARTINTGVTARRRLMFGRVAVLVVAVLAAITAVRRLGIIVQLVAWAFSLAAATFFPVLVLGIFWKRANAKGAVAGMIAGFVTALSYMVLNLADPSFNVLGISNVASGIFGIPMNLLVTIVVSKLTAPPSAEAQAVAELLRQP